ncbi:glycosyltransferase family 4 protein [Algibacter sp. 2305UL17-15]|uniref:glycosyltransferase family 4 protein n=1 Tax=Algibacter sp. 2305UL17-15 TaxID=3231268 RepID=UPI0034579A68
MNNKKRILVLSSLDHSLINFRGDFIKSLVKEGYKVYAGAPEFGEQKLKELKALGAIPVSYYLQRTGLNPFNDLKTIFNLKKIIKENNIDLVYSYTVKPVIYGSIAANMNKTPVVSLITGLGFAFTGLTFKARTLQRLNEFLYKLSIRKNKTIIFQNSDDYQLFLDRKIISKHQKVGFVGGSGVNLEQFKTRVNENSTDVISFIIVSRLIKEKGIELYLNAAQTLKVKYPKAEFHVIGAPENSPSAVDSKKLNMLNDDGTIVYHGPQNNIPQHLYKRDIFVLPTYYREGVPRSILEALSVGLPVITTNTPGCKETVINKKNGFLIEPQNLDKLIEAMEYFLINKESIKEMGINSRNYAKEKFDVNIINKNLLKMINNILNPTTAH